MGGVLSVELKGELLKKPDLTLQKTHDHCHTLEAAELQKFKLLEQRSLGIQPESSRNLTSQLLIPVSFVVTSTNLLNHISA